MELRQLRYFLATAEELHFSRAAERLGISGPALSQQIIALERELGVELLVRDRRGVELTEAGRSLAQDARQMLALAQEAADRARQRSAATTSLRLGYVSWLPDVLDALAARTAALRLDDWVLPSHAQVDRVADGSLDLALAWISADAVQARGLTAHLIRAEPLRAVVPGAAANEPVPAAEVTVLLDSDKSTWSSWNEYAQAFAAEVGANVARIDDGGIAGDAFHAHVRRLGVPLLASPKRHTAARPPSLGIRPVAEPVPLWTWSLLHRADDERAVVRDAVQTLTAAARARRWTAPPAENWWVPDNDPHRALLATDG